METIITTLAMFSVIRTLYFFKDVITEFLSEGKSFVSNELKSFK